MGLAVYSLSSRHRHLPRLLMNFKCAIYNTLLTMYFVQYYGTSFYPFLGNIVNKLKNIETPSVGWLVQSVTHETKQKNIKTFI